MRAIKQHFREINPQNSACARRDHLRTKNPAGWWLSCFEGIDFSVRKRRVPRVWPLRRARSRFSYVSGPASLLRVNRAIARTEVPPPRTGLTAGGTCRADPWACAGL
jgi:hypothetical protein